MNKSVALATLFGCLAGGCMGATVRIVTDGVFENGTRVSSGGEIFDGTNSFEQLTAPGYAIFNLGLFLGEADTGWDSFTLVLQQQWDTGKPVTVGTWKAYLRDNLLQFESRPLYVSDGQYEYIWILMQHQYDVSAGSVAVNALLIMIDSSSLIAGCCRSQQMQVTDVSTRSTGMRLDGFRDSPIFLNHELAAVADAYSPDVIVRRIRCARA